MIIEQWKEFNPGVKLKLRYAISNYGRVKSFENSITDGRILKGTIVNGYKCLKFRHNTSEGLKHKTLYVHRLVAENFLHREPGQDSVIFLNYNKSVAHVSNLRWVDYTQMIQHNAQSPASIRGREKAREKNMKRDGHKLRETDVMLLKKKLQSKKTRVKTLAKRFNVTETTIYRIARNENWGHVII